VALWEARAFIQ